MANLEHLAMLKAGIAAWNSWRTLNPDIEVDLSGSDLSKSFLVGAYLSNVNLSAANLSGALLQRARLKRANAQNADFSEANLTNANLVLINLKGATLKAANLQNSALTEAILSEAKLIRADLQGADLSKADLTGTRLFRTNLTGANLTGVDLRPALLQDTDLSNANLSGCTLDGNVLNDSILIGANLSGVNLSGLELGSAKLNKVDLRGADLRRTNLRGADLREANLSEADMGEAIMGNAELSDAILFKAEMSGINLRRATLSRANLSHANMISADLSAAQLHHASLTQANLHRAILYSAELIDANLIGADLTCANLQSASLNNADLTGAHLWETQRAGWSISDVICEHAFWDRAGKKAIVYAPGEFERLYSEQTTIELFYQDGISSFELNTLPALLQHLASKHPDASIHLKTIEQTGGGAKITISLGDADHSLKEQVEEEALKIVKAQLTLRENENLRLQIQNDLLREQQQETIRLMLSAAAPQITFNAPVHTAALPSGNAKVELYQTFNDNTQLIQLIDKLLSRNTELTAPQSAEIESAKAELHKPEPDKSLLTRTLGFLKKLPAEAVLKGAGKLGEKAAEADWSSLLHQLGDLVHHLH